MHIVLLIKILEDTYSRQLSIPIIAYCLLGQAYLTNLSIKILLKTTRNALLKSKYSASTTLSTLWVICLITESNQFHQAQCAALAPCWLLAVTPLTFKHQNRTSKRTCSINFVMPLLSCYRAATWWCWPTPLVLLKTSHLDHLASVCPTCLSAPLLCLPPLWVLPQRRLQPAS